MYKLFSQRLKGKENQKHSLQYDFIPPAFIQQFFFIAEDYFNHLPKPLDEEHRYWEALCKIYCLEAGIPLIGEYSGKYKRDLQNFIEDPETDSLVVLDIAELAFSKIPSDMTFYYSTDPMAKYHNEEAINALNERFQQHSLGYRFLDNQIVRIDSELIEKEITQPAVLLLRNPLFSSADEEFQKALRFRRDGDYAESIFNANKAFESVMKVICSEMKYPEVGQIKSESAGSYLSLLRKHQFYPSYSEDHFSALCNTLEKGLPVLRNKKGSHGAGPNSTRADSVSADYALHLAATDIVFLVDLFEQQTKQK